MTTKKKTKATTEKTTASGPAIVDYLSGLGIDVDPASMAPPTVSALYTASADPTKWIDKNGDLVPVDAVGELYRIDATVGDSMTQRFIRSKEAEGFKVVPREAGLRWQCIAAADEANITMVRTPEAKSVFDEAQRLKRSRRMGKHTQRPNLPGDGEATQTVKRRDINLANGPVPLRA